MGAKDGVMHVGDLCQLLFGEGGAAAGGLLLLVAVAVAVGGGEAFDTLPDPLKSKLEGVGGAGKEGVAEYGAVFHRDFKGVEE